MPVKQMDVDMPFKYGYVRFVCIASTCGKHEQIAIPHGDVLIIAGDFTTYGDPKDMVAFNKFLESNDDTTRSGWDRAKSSCKAHSAWNKVYYAENYPRSYKFAHLKFSPFPGSLPHQFKLLISGSNEIPLDPSWRFPRSNHLASTYYCDLLKPVALSAGNYRQMVKRKCNLRDDSLKYSLEGSLQEMKINDARELLTNAIYMEDSEVCVSGIRVYGTPWQPYYDDWAFSAGRRQQLKDKYNKIPKGIDVLLTYAPPLGFGDKTSAGVHIGSVELLNVTHSNVHPKYHVFGYPCEGHGCFTNGSTKFINACCCDASLNPKNVPIVFDIKIPE
ncbi:unnamed protein product [Soboliphyme baturini]|uniref:Metalloendopeptidase n=1 Tax=Soboliphyme baturini TaxID=241478 RepID=A0A183IV30_9BILA|nr:unnamed protein product [Soboliphyme baturini]